MAYLTWITDDLLKQAVKNVLEKGLIAKKNAPQNFNKNVVDHEVNIDGEGNVLLHYASEKEDIEPVEENGIGIAIMDRIKKAVFKYK